MKSLKNKKLVHKNALRKFGRYLRAGLLCTSAVVIGVVGTAPNTISTNYEYISRATPAVYQQKVDLSTTEEIYCKEAEELLDRGNGKWNTKELKDLNNSYLSFIRSTNRQPSDSVKRIMPLVIEVAKKQNVDPEVIGGIIMTESMWFPYTIGSKGDLGLMQINPKSYKLTDYEYKHIFDPIVNITIGIGIYKSYLDMFDGDVSKAIEAYNAGPEKVIRHRIPHTVRAYLKGVGIHMAFVKENMR